MIRILFFPSSPRLPAVLIWVAYHEMFSLKIFELFGDLLILNEIVRSGSRLEKCWIFLWEKIKKQKKRLMCERFGIYKIRLKSKLDVRRTTWKGFCTLNLFRNAPHYEHHEVIIIWIVFPEKKGYYFRFLFIWKFWIHSKHFFFCIYQCGKKNYGWGIFTSNKVLLHERFTVFEKLLFPEKFEMEIQNWQIICEFFGTLNLKFKYPFNRSGHLCR